jgi:hypothetical protein
MIIFSSMQVQSGEEKVEGTGTVFICSFCAVGYGSQEKLLEHLPNHVDIPHKPTSKGNLCDYFSILC